MAPQQPRRFCYLDRGRRVLGVEPSGIVEIAASTFSNVKQTEDLPDGTGSADKPCASRVGEQGRRDEREIRV